MHDRLGAAGAELFWRQDAADQRHAYEVAERVTARLSNDEDAYTAALLHDVGKAGAGLGAVGRSIATVLDGVGLPLTGSMKRYRSHGPIGAAELADAGYDGIVVAFAEHHPGPAPGGIDPERWEVLLEADG